MPTLWEYIYTHLRAFAFNHGKKVLHVAKCTFVVLILGMLLEVFVFNFNYWSTRGLNTINLSDSSGMHQTSDEKWAFTTVSNVIEYSNLNKKVENIRIDFDAAQPAQNVDVKIQFTDDAHLTYFDTTEYSAGVPTVQVATNADNTEYIKLATQGYVHSLRIEVGGEDINYPIKVNGVYINNGYPFSFNTTRFFLCAFILALLYVFRPRSSIYHISMQQRPRATKAIVIATVCVEMVLLSSFLFMGSNLVGLATSNYNSGSWNKNSLITSFEVGGENAQQYARLAEAMAHGQLYLEEEPPQWLQDMDNPFDMGARNELQKQTGEEYLWDVAYYNGHYYVYFGVVPVLVFYLPYYLLLGFSFPTALGVLISCLAFVLGITALLDRFARYHFKRVSIGLYLLLQIPMVFCCGILYLLKFPTFYSLPIMMALAFTAWGLYFWLRGRSAKKACLWYLLGSLCMALVVGCRPQLAVLSLVAFPLFWRHFITRGHIKTRHGAKEFVCLLAPYFIVAAGIMWYNNARFGSFTDFGSNYNLTTNDMTKRGMDVGRLAPALFAYFLQTPTTTGVFPYLQPSTFATTYMGQTIKEVTFGGIFACLPILWVLPFAKRALKMRIQARSTRTVAGVVLCLIGGGVVLALLDAEMAGILQRYYADFSFMFLAAAVLIIFILNENLAEDQHRWRICMRVLLLLVILSLVYMAMLCLVPETGWYSDAYPWAYQSILKTFEFWT